MALERRGNRYYFYEKKRIGNRVVSIYSGGGEMAWIRQILNQDRQDEARLEGEKKNRSFEAEKLRQNEIDQLIESTCEDAKAFEDALFLTNGYHTHERQWRRKRNGQKLETKRN